MWRATVIMTSGRTLSGEVPRGPGLPGKGRRPCLRCRKRSRQLFLWGRGGMGLVRLLDHDRSPASGRLPGLFLVWPPQYEEMEEAGGRGGTIGRPHRTLETTMRMEISLSGDPICISGSGWGRERLITTFWSATILPPGTPWVDRPRKLYREQSSFGRFSESDRTMEHPDRELQNNRRERSLQATGNAEYPKPGRPEGPRVHPSSLSFPGRSAG